MGLITFLLLGAFSLLYVSKSLQKKPEFVDKAVAAITRNIDNLAMGGVIYGLVAACLAPIMIANSTEMLLRLLANILVVVLALPHVFDKLAAKFEGKLNAAIMQEVRSAVGWISAKEKLVGIAGAIVTVLLFGVLFR